MRPFITPAALIFGLLLTGPLYALPNSARPSILLTREGKPAQLSVQLPHGELQRIRIVREKKFREAVPHESHYIGYTRSRDGFRSTPISLTVVDGIFRLHTTDNRKNRPLRMSWNTRNGRSAVRSNRLPRAARPLSCGASAAPYINSSLALPTEGEFPILAPPRALRLAVVVDKEFLEQKGTDAKTYIRETITAMEALYLRQLGIAVELASILQAPDADPAFTDEKNADRLLDRFRDAILGFALDPSVDAYHLVTGKSLDAGVIGLAFLGVTCPEIPEDGYPFSLSRIVGAPLQPILTAHEIAHNLGAAHDEAAGSIMNPNIGPSDDQFSALSATSIFGYINRAGVCLEAAEEIFQSVAVRRRGPSLSISGTVSHWSESSCEILVDAGNSSGNLIRSPLTFRRLSVAVPGRYQPSRWRITVPLPSKPWVESRLYVRARARCGSSAADSPVTIVKLPSNRKSRRSILNWLRTVGN